ncbi:conserved hypothetical protein [Talaromyces stipitatus ATCC 10500]|uniref:Rho-GAP domain-containing protein n=1 Tax=Talaromyces stipitatus (strain ATCC 10500 / CBS 375.48 / QM 6759 / NRRL 1006) TaxID=441959 RepID=B8LYI3_TALSN|nr:uncharacterized protein TSTA_063870 [Talaromyces stipitatus ATCC 10500]EED22912.1 conserved hypothetical protein [Talaromyces stipitatus ATCC 10500]
MAGFLRVLKDLPCITRTPRAGADQVTLSPLSPSWSENSVVDKTPSSLPTEGVQWEQRELEAELYESLYTAFAQHDNIPPGELSSSAAATSSYAASSAIAVESERYAKNVTFKDYSHLVENLPGLPMDQASSSISVKEGSTVDGPSVPTSRGLFHYFHETSARVINAVKTAIGHHRDGPVGDSADSKSRSQNSFVTHDSTTTVYHWSDRHSKFPCIRTSSSGESFSGSGTSENNTFVYGTSDYAPPAVSCLPEYGWPHHRLFSDISLHGRQRTAFLAYNELAREYGSYALVPPEYDPISKFRGAFSAPLQLSLTIMEDFQMFIRLKPSKRELILRKVRSIGSHLRPRSPTRRARNLRRMRTFANLSLKYYKMDSLKGKDLATMGRMCGYGSLTLPGDFAPAVMRLPAPIVSLVSYLVTHGPKARNIFHEPGDVVVASRIYDHFASQILTPEGEESGNMTVRRSYDFSSEVFGVHSDNEDFLRGRFHVLSVAWAFKYILACIPGGILGSPRLYPTLVDIMNLTFPDEPTFPQRGLNGALPEVSPTKARAISLAILALTNDMQLDFLCAIFGLCSFLDHETRTMLDFYKSKNIPPINRACLLDRKRILLTFTPLLCEDTKAINDDDYGCEAFWVMGMMLDYWRVVSRHLADADI